MFQPADTEPTASIERFLTGAMAKLPPPDLLFESGLAAYASSRVSDEHAFLELRSAHLTASARHVAIRSEVVRLLRSWKQAGVEALLFKGFHLAEFVYPEPGQRHYSDVDLLIAAKDSGQAAKLARECGWQVLWRADAQEVRNGLQRSGYRGHELLQLRHEGLGVRLDVHRRLVHNNHNRLGGYQRQQRITRLAWQQSEWVELQGVPVRQLNPLDAVLVGLMLNRCWSPEDWQLRPHDYLDFHYLTQRFSFREDALRTRAAKLGCSRTLDIFLQRCNPFKRVCRLDRPSQLDLHTWNLQVAPERGNRYLQRALPRLLAFATGPLEVGAALPGLPSIILRARRAQPRQLARELMGEPIENPRSLSGQAWLSLRRGTHRSFRLLGLASPRNRDLEAVALLAALRRRSCPARLVWVSSSEGDERPSLELEGVPLHCGGTLLAD